MTTDTNLTPFAIALQRRLSERGSKTALAKALGLSASLVSDWLRGDIEPSPRKVIAIEEHLGVGPGTLTVHLGYMPVAAGQVSLASPESAIIADERLTAAQKRVLLGMLDQLTERQEQP